MNGSEHRGISVSQVDVPGVFTGTLSFCIGHRHEPPHLAGITHLAEHLVFRSVGQIVPSHDGTVTENNVEFYAAGEPSEVAEFLNRIAKVVRSAEFTAADLDLERRVIEAEQPGDTFPGRGLLTARYGLESVGKASAGNPSLWSITIEEVREWVLRWFVVENAHLSFTGPVPPELSVELNSGLAIEVSSTSQIAQTPMLLSSARTSVALSVVVEPQLGRFVADVLVEELTAALRTRHGLIYSVDADLTYVDAQHCVLDFILDPIDEITQTVKLALEAIRAAGRGGPSAHAVAAARASVRAQFSSPAAWAQHQDERIVLEPLGITALDPEATIAFVDSVGPEALKSVLSQAWDSLVVMVEEDEADLPSLASEFNLTLADEELGVPDNARRRGPGRLWLGAFGSIFRYWCRLDDNILWWTERGVTRRVDLDDIVVAGQFADGALALIDRQGCSDIVFPALWIRGRGLVSAIIECLPEQIVRDFSWHDNRPARDSFKAD